MGNAQWQSRPVTRKGKQVSFDYPEGSRGGRGAIELGSPDAFVRWIVRIADDDITARTEVFETGPASLAALDVPETGSVNITPYVIATVNDLEAPLRCHFGADGLPKRTQIVTPSNGVDPATLSTVSVVAPEPLMVTRFREGLTAKDLAKYERTQWASMVNEMGYPGYGVNVDFSDPSVAVPMPQVFYVDPLDTMQAATVAPAGYRRTLGREYPNSLGAGLPAGSSFVFIVYALDENGNGVIKSTWSQHPGREVVLHAWDIVTAFLLATAPGSGNPTSGFSLNMNID